MEIITRPSLRKDTLKKNRTNVLSEKEENGRNVAQTHNDLHIVREKVKLFLWEYLQSPGKSSIIIVQWWQSGTKVVVSGAEWR